jgi:IS4 transposase
VFADRNFFGFELWNQARSTGADPFWRVKELRCQRKRVLTVHLSRVYGSPKEQRHGENGVVVRVTEYRLEGIPGAEPIYRLLTTILDYEAAPATELAAIYHERWEIETALDELKTHLRGSRIVLRSKTPDLVRQEFYGLMMAHFAVRGLMHEAALKANEDPDKLSFLHAVRVVRRKIARFASIPPSGQEGVS